MKTLILAFAPLILAASPAAAQNHDHAHHAPAAASAPAQATPPAPTAKTCTCPKCPEHDATHDCPMHGKPPEDPHAGHDMRGMQTAPATAPAADPHAGHNMGAAPAAAADPHAGHDMSGMQTVPAKAPAAILMRVTHEPGSGGCGGPARRTRHERDADGPGEGARL